MLTQGENYNYRDALILSHYEVEELPAREKDRVSRSFTLGPRYITGIICRTTDDILSDCLTVMLIF